MKGATMPVTGRSKKAKPIHVWEAGEKIWGHFFVKAFPKPKSSESFNEYMERIDWKEEAIFKALIAIGCTSDGSEPNQRCYLMDIQDMSSELFKLNQELHSKYPDR